jgi:hypothetical protein
MEVFRSNIYFSNMNFIKHFYFGLAVACILFSCASPRNEAKQGNEIKVISDGSKNAHSVYLTKNHKGEAVICWTEQDTTVNGEKHFYFSVFDSLVNDFGNKISVPIEQNAALHTEGMPKIAFKNNGETIAVYEVKIESEFNPYAGEIHYIVSMDNGNSWSEPQIVHSSKTPHKGRAFFDMITLSDGEIGVSWLGESHLGGGRPVMFAKTNQVNEFVNEVVVDSIACECCRTAIYSDSKGMISIVYRDIVNDSIRDISVSTSLDNGKSFSNPICFSGDNWNINGCPHNGPDVVSDKENIYAVWFTGASESGIYFAKLNKESLNVEKKLISKNGRNIQLAIAEDEKPIIVYSENYSKNEVYYSKINILKLSDSKTVEITNELSKAHSPTIMIQDGIIIVSWITSGTKTETIEYKILNKNAL